MSMESMEDKLLSIVELRKKTGLSQSKFAEKYHIKLNTLTQWEQGLRKAPEHVVYMLQRLVCEVDNDATANP